MDLKHATPYSPTTVRVKAGDPVIVDDANIIAVCSSSQKPEDPFRSLSEKLENIQINCW